MTFKLDSALRHLTVADADTASGMVSAFNPSLSRGAAAAVAPQGSVQAIKTFAQGKQHHWLQTFTDGSSSVDVNYSNYP